MANRHLSRSVVLQSLFEWDFRGFAENGVGPAGSASGTTVAAIEDATSIIARNAKEFAPGVGDISFIEELMANILAKRAELDLVIEKAAPDWPIDKISIVDRNILRIGLYELIFADRKEVPAKVAINESIELAKTFGGENSSKFVNGVLGSVYKELGEPGKDDIAPKKRAKIEDVPYEKMPIQNLGGAVVFSRDGGKGGKDEKGGNKSGDIYLAFVHDIFGHWTLSKGKIAEGIPVREGTVAKVKEEMGLDIVITEDLGSNEYIASDPEKGKLRKQVHYYLAESPFVDIKLADKPGLDDAKWFKLADILELNFYNDILPIVTKAITILAASQSTAGINTESTAKLAEDSAEKPVAKSTAEKNAKK
jgi:N utilization substance protein B